MILESVDDDIELARSRWNKAHQRGDDRAIGIYQNRLSKLREKHEEVVMPIRG